MTKQLIALLVIASLGASAHAADPTSDASIARWVEDALVRDSSRGPDSAEALYDRVGGRPDLAIAREASIELRAHMGSHFSGLVVASTAGIVTLRGRVDDAEARTDAEARVRAIRGVVDVLNGLSLDGEQPAPTPAVVADTGPGRAGPLTFITDDLLGGTDIGVYVENGRVTLTGLVSSTDARDWAMRQVRRLPGVRVVDDKLSVRNGTREDDRRIEIIVYRKVERTMGLWDVFRGLAITSRDGVLRLQGVVNTESQRDLVEVMAAETNSVLAVESRLEVDPAFRLPISEGISEHGSLNSTNDRRPRTTYLYGNYRYGYGN